MQQWTTQPTSISSQKERYGDPSFQIYSGSDHKLSFTNSFVERFNSYVHDIVMAVLE